LNDENTKLGLSLLFTRAKLHVLIKWLIS